MAGVSIHALTVSDNPKKFVIAVTRARVDSPSFLVVIPPVVRSTHHMDARRSQKFTANPVPANRNSSESTHLRGPGALITL
jgi:hypothetical protein